jgi:hypothetical protein
LNGNNAFGKGGKNENPKKDCDNLELTLFLKSLETKPMNIEFPNLLKETTWM